MILKTLRMGETEKVVSVQEAERERKRVKLDIRIVDTSLLRMDQILYTEHTLKKGHREFAEENGYKVLCSDCNLYYFAPKPYSISLALLIEDKEAVLEDERLEKIIREYQYEKHPNLLALLNELFEEDLVIPGD